MTNHPSPYQIEADLFIALSHPVRLKILDVLRAGESCVCHIQATLNQRQAYISQHINVLRNAGLVTARKEGQRVFYQTSDPAIYSVLDHFANLLQSEGRLHSAEEVKEVIQPKNCHCPRCSGQNPRKETIQDAND